jgi:tetratricopeptide (TPR) repeat protein
VPTGLTYQAQRTRAAAAEAYESALDATRNDAGRRHALGRAARAWLRAGEPERALPLLEAALASDPKDPTLRALLEQAGEAAGPSGPRSS